MDELAENRRAAIETMRWRTLGNVSGPDGKPLAYDYVGRMYFSDMRFLQMAPVVPGEMTAREFQKLLSTQPQPHHHPAPDIDWLQVNRMFSVGGEDVAD
jgi:hypothetical protein